MEKEKEINSTSQLIKVIRGEETSLIPEDDPVVEHYDSARSFDITKVIIFSLILCMIAFTFLSVYYLSGEIGQLEKTRAELIEINMSLDRGKDLLPEVRQKLETAKKIDNLSMLLTGQRPYVSSVIKEITRVIPKNCYLNRVHIFMPATNFSDQKANMDIEATLVDMPPLIGNDPSRVIGPIEDSPLFGKARIGYQDRSNLFRYRTIEFQLDFPIEQ